VRHRRHIGNRCDADAQCAQSAHRRFTTWTGTLDFDIKVLDTLVDGSATSHFGSHLGCEGGGLARALETLTTGRRPRQALPWRSVMVMMVLLNEACTCATPSETFLRTFLRTRCAALLAGDLAILIFQSLFLQCRCTLARTLASAGIGTRTLTTHWQTTAMAETTVATDVHQTLDVHRGFTAQVTFNGELLDLLANFFQIAIVRSLIFLL
jgi:hypothetical protein